MTETEKKQEQQDSFHRQWRSRLKKRRGKAFKSVTMRELNLVAMMDMMTIILVFLLKSYTGSALSIDVSNLQFPESKNQIAPEDAVRLMISKIDGATVGVISVDDDEVVQLQPTMVKTLYGQISRTKGRIFKIDKLYDALKVKADQARIEASKIEGRTFEGKILVIADRDTPYWLVTQVLLSAAEAGYDKYNLVALKDERVSSGDTRRNPI